MNFKQKQNKIAVHIRIHTNSRFAYITINLNYTFFFLWHSNAFKEEKKNVCLRITRMGRNEKISYYPENYFPLSFDQSVPTLVYLTTLALCIRASAVLFHSRNNFKKEKYIKEQANE